MQGKILVTGGAGYIGSVVARKLTEAGEEVIIIDDLSTGSRARRPGSGLSGPAFSGPHDCAGLVNALSPAFPLAPHPPADGLIFAST